MEVLRLLWRVEVRYRGRQVYWPLCVVLQSLTGWSSSIAMEAEVQQAADGCVTDGAHGISIVILWRTKEASHR